jgi:deoxyribodipyrimidine photo-lyase
MSEEAQVVWFKRDLRVADHAPLAGAAAAGPVVPLYIVEPAVWGAADFDRMHARFVIESLEELAASLRELGAPLVVRVGDAVAVWGDAGSG